MSRDARDPAYWSQMYREFKAEASRARVAAMCALYDTLYAWEDGGDLGVAILAATEAAEWCDDLIALAEAAQLAVADRDFVPLL